MQRWCTILCTLIVAAAGAWAQSAPTIGLRNNTPAVHAFTNARIVVAPGKVISNGTLVIRKGVIEAVGEKVTPPADARVWDMKGLTLYPGLIELASDLGMPKPPPAQGGGGFGGGAAAASRPEPPKGAAHWNAKMFADVAAANEFQADARAAEKLRSQGFTLALTSPQRGIFRGTSALVNVGEGKSTDLIVKPRVAHHVGLEATGGFLTGYPNSLMGIIAFIRQSWNDADWYRKAHDTYNKKSGGRQRPETNTALATLADALQYRQPVIMTASNKLNFLRVAKIGKEFGLNLWAVGSGEEYQRLDAIKAAKIPVILPLNFPEAPAVDVPEEALNTSLEELRHWDAAPENPGRLEKAGVPIALTSHQLKDAGSFLAQVRKAIERGLSADGALAAVTTTPATWLGIDKQYGTLEAGKVANIVITDGDLFGEKTKIREVWIDGARYEVKVPPTHDARGSWDLLVSADPQQSGTLSLKGEIDKPSGSVTWRGKELRLASVQHSAGRISFTMVTDSIGLKGTMMMSGTVGDKMMQGIGERNDGSGFTWSATRREPMKEEADTVKPKKVEMASFPDVFPAGEYGRPELPDQPQNVLIRNATIWTQGPQGRLENTDMIVSRGKITRIGRNLAVPGDALVIDAAGKHVSPGLIDAHSHAAVSGSVNEGGQAITPEVRIADVLDPEDIWIYRQLAGGTTAANILHGSANPIGGQNAVVKWRWGALPDELLIVGAPAGVKFALGENVKQSHFRPGGQPSTRYPQTRMGVEQIIRDRFQAAFDYERSWKEWEKDKTNIPPRKDLELDAILEMLKGTRLIHSHCYRQDEILMLIRVAEDFGIKIATFQHVLEGYKVAEAIAKHGAGASAFSDWWSFKMEAFDAIPGNGPLMHSQGVLVSYNSDNAQLATRMNWEASKAVKFGLSEEEALKFVTINAAKQLRIDDKVGSLEMGKDADFVIWSGNPISTYSQCEQTWVDGRKFFDLREDAQLRQQIQKERSTLIQKIHANKQSPSGPAPAAGAPRLRRPNETVLRSCMEGFYDEE
ncbi:MAG: amidohydrolase family protein [Bacteroidota bacterium]